MDEDKSTVRAVDRALHILKCFTFEQKEMNLADLCKVSGLPKTTVFRLLASLEKSGFVVKDERTQTYRLGMVLFQLGNIVSSSIELRKISLPIMEELAKKTKETININIVQGQERVCIEKVDGSHDLREFIQVGRSLPLYKGASGKILLAYLPEAIQKEILKNAASNLKEPAENVLKQLETIRRNGYAVSQNERVLGAAAVSAPILNYDGKLVAGLTISGATVRFTKEKIDEFIKLVVNGAKEISKNLGYKDRE